MADKKFECRGCCKYPHGKLSIILSVLAFIAWIFTLSATSTCNFVTVNGFGVGPITAEYCVGSVCECQAYTSADEEFHNGAHNASKAFGLLATIFGFFIMIIAFVVGCMKFPVLVFKVIAGICAALAVCCLLMLSIFGSDWCELDADGCSFGAGAALALLSFFLWTGCAVLAFLIKEAPEQGEPSVVTATPSKPYDNKVDSTPGTVTVTEETLPDGSIKTTKTTINPDGTQTVTESIDVPRPTTTTTAASPSASAPPIPRREEQPVPPVAYASATPAAASMPPAAATTKERPAVATMKDHRPVINAD